MCYTTNCITLINKKTNKDYLSTSSAPTISWMWYFMWNLTCEVVRRSCSSACKTSLYLDFFTMPSTALRPDGKTQRGVSKKKNPQKAILSTETLLSVQSIMLRQVSPDTHPVLSTLWIFQSLEWKATSCLHLSQSGPLTWPAVCKVRGGMCSGNTAAHLFACRVN